MTQSPDLSPMCPANGLPCEGKQYLLGMLEGSEHAQFSVQLLEPTVPIEASAADETLAAHLAERDVVNAAVRRDLASHCTGVVCGPLAETASRFILDGYSHTETLAEAKKTKES